MVYEYKVIPAPAKGRKARGVRKAEDKFALAVQESMNEMAQMGWEFVRSETLPNTERTGLTRRSTTERSLLVFRREVAKDPKSSLEATLREVEKPKTVAAPTPIPAEPLPPAAAEPQPQAPVVAEASADDPIEPLVSADPHADAETVVRLNKPAPQVKTAEPKDAKPEEPRPIKQRLAAVDETSFPDPRGPETPRPDSQALYTKDSVKPAKTAKSGALPAALRSRASQSQDGKKA